MVGPMRTLLIGTLLALILATPARADTVFPGQHPAESAAISQIVPLGRDYWLQRHIEPCAAPAILAAPRLVSEDGMEHQELTQVGGCTIWLEQGIVRDAERYPLASGNEAVFCTTIVHALGHTAGLLDGSTAVMAGVPPAVCRHRVQRRARQTARRACWGAQIGRAAGR